MKDRESSFAARLRRGHRLHSIDGLEDIQAVRSAAVTAIYVESPITAIYVHTRLL
jgi:hypothetical protein